MDTHEGYSNQALCYLIHVFYTSTHKYVYWINLCRINIISFIEHDNNHDDVKNLMRPDSSIYIYMNAYVCINKHTSISIYIHISLTFPVQVRFMLRCKWRRDWQEYTYTCIIHIIFNYNNNFHITRKMIYLLSNDPSSQCYEHFNF